MHEIPTEVKRVKSVNLQSSAAATLNGASSDASGFATAMAEIDVGTIDASTTVDAKVQESDDGSAWSDITGAAITQLVAADDDKQRTINIRSLDTRKKYLRIVIVVGGSNNAVVAGALLLGGPHRYTSRPAMTADVNV